VSLSSVPDPSPPDISTLKVDVVILTWNDGVLLRHAVESALASQGVEVTVTVIDNGSDPPIEVDPDPRVTLIRNDANRGVAPARNQGVAAGNAPLVCLLDSDARLHTDTLLVLSHVATDRVALVAPVFHDQIPEASGGRAPGFRRKAGRALGITSVYGSTRPDRHSTSWEVDFVIGACQLIRREAFESIGGLDGTIFYGPEDVDFCLRLRVAGWSVVQTALTSCHHPPRRRNRRLFTRRGLAHAAAVFKHLRRHRATPTLDASRPIRL